MMNIYVLSHDGNLVVDNQRVNTYRWVRVSANQIMPGMTTVPVLPEDKPGTVVRYGIVGNGQVSLRVMGNGLLRELTDDEGETQTIRIPRI